MSEDGVMVSQCFSRVYVGGNRWGKTVSKQDHLIYEERCDATENYTAPLKQCTELYLAVFAKIKTSLLLLQNADAFIGIF